MEAFEGSTITARVPPRLRETRCGLMVEGQNASNTAEPRPQPGWESTNDKEEAGKKQRT
jgi:hypothetical protein